LPDDGASYRSFGTSADIYGDTIVIGSDRDDPSGSAYIFHKDGSHWTQQAKLEPNDGSETSHFGGCVALHKSRLIVGQYWKCYDYAAHIFAGRNNIWSREAVIAPNDITAWKRFGISVGIHNDTAIVGADWDDETIDNGGSAYIFDFVSRADLDKNDIVNGRDFAILASQWRKSPGIPSADIAPEEGDGMVNWLDLDVFADEWLWHK
jgi:hypothetical protein